MGSGPTRPNVPTIPDDYESTLEVTVSRDMKDIVELAKRQQALLIVLSEPCLGSRVLLAETPVDIGRGARGGLLIDSDSVSRRHARVEWTSSSHKIVDLGSTNGTFVNGSRVQDHELRDGDRVQIGKVLLKYIAGGNIEATYHEEFQRLMRFDALTGVLNKRQFGETLRSAMGGTQRLSLMVLDLDHFKKINDTFGHVVGDGVLMELCSVARETMKDNEAVFGRVGGEEFAVFWEGGDKKAMLALAEELRRATEEHRFTFEGKRLSVTVSIGVAEFDRNAKETDEMLYDRADAKLYEAKAAGRNTVRG
jgi:two-component system, cell cycle response regulator